LSLWLAIRPIDFRPKSVPNFIPRFMAGFFSKIDIFPKKMIIYFEKSHFLTKKGFFDYYSRAKARKEKLYFWLRETPPFMVMISIKSSAGFRAPKNFLFENKNSPFFQVFQKKLVAKFFFFFTNFFFFKNCVNFINKWRWPKNYRCGICFKIIKYWKYEKLLYFDHVTTKIMFHNFFFHFFIYY
jgi:hypothetical protein